MHALHRPDLRSAHVLVTMLAAMLAIIATLWFTTGPTTDLGHGSMSPHGGSAASGATPAPKLFTGNPLTRPLGAPLRLPWAAGRARDDQVHAVGVGGMTERR